MTIVSIARHALAGCVALPLLALPAMAQVAPGVGVGAGGASAGLGGGVGTGAGAVNTTGAGTGMSAPGRIGSGSNTLNGSPNALPGFGTGSSPGLANPSPNAGIAPPVVGYGTGMTHRGMAMPAGRASGTGTPR